MQYAELLQFHNGNNGIKTRIKLQIRQHFYQNYKCKQKTEKTKNKKNKKRNGIPV